MIKIKRAWYMKQLPCHIVAELPDERLVMFRLSPFSRVSEADFRPYRGYHPSKCAAWPVPDYALKHYGLLATEPK